MQINTDGLVVKEMSISDKDKLITILTRDKGLIRAFVKNAKNLKNKNAVGTQLLCYSQFIIYKTRDKYIVNEAFAEQIFFNLRNNIEKLSIAQYFCELTMYLFDENIASETLLRLILNALHFLCNKKIDNKLIKSIVEMRIISISGYMPNLIACKICSKYESNYMYFCVDKGCIYCDKCFNYKSTSTKEIKLNIGSLTALRHSIYADFKKLFSFHLAEKSANFFFKASEEYVLSKLDKNLKSLDFYKQICYDIK